MDKLLDTHLSGQYGLTAKIKDALMEVRHQFVYIGFLLDEADRLEYYREGGYESIYEYCEDTFGFKKSSTNNFIRVYRTFGEYMGLQEKYRDYSYSQLTEMCSMTPNQLRLCSPDSTVSYLRSIKKKCVNFQTSGKVEPEPDPVQTSGKEAIDFGTLDISNKGFIRVSARQLCNLWLDLSDECGPMDTICIYEPDNWNDDLNYFMSDEGV